MLAQLFFCCWSHCPWIYFEGSVVSYPLQLLPISWTAGLLFQLFNFARFQNLPLCLSVLVTCYSSEFCFSSDYHTQSLLFRSNIRTGCWTFCRRGFNPRLGLIKKPAPKLNSYERLLTRYLNIFFILLTHIYEGSYLPLLNCHCEDLRIRRSPPSFAAISQ